MDPKRISRIGHSEDTIIAPSVAIDNATKVKNIILMGTVAQNIRHMVYFHYIFNSIYYAEQVLDHNHTGAIWMMQIAGSFVTEVLVLATLSFTNQ
ncbi:MAG: hypothetical protein DLM72_12030 [Candidatus Nitrosopolaris wilkensis]|nr:MAG: hypothetical protein DLM72_12030 [Candidatus Nitrosopolaris wilkensis]